MFGTEAMMVALSNIKASHSYTRPLLYKGPYANGTPAIASMNVYFDGRITNTS